MIKLPIVLIYQWACLIRRRKCCDGTRYCWRQTGRETYLEGREVLPCEVNTKIFICLFFPKFSWTVKKKWAGGLQETDEMKSCFRAGISTVTAELSWLGSGHKTLCPPAFWLEGHAPPPPVAEPMYWWVLRKKNIFGGVGHSNADTPRLRATSQTLRCL